MSAAAKTGAVPVLPASFGRILVIRRDNIGDLLCTTPLLAALRRRYPEAHIAVLANSYNAPVLAANPDIDRVHAYSKAKHTAAPRLLSWYREWNLYRRLRAERFDLVIHANPIPHRRTGRLVRYLGAPYRLGVDDGEESYNLPVAAADIPHAHHAEQVWALLAPLGMGGAPGPLRLIAPGLANGSLGKSAPGSGPIVGIHLSSRKPCNRWPAESYERLIAGLLARGLPVRLFWAPGSERNRRHPGDDEMAAQLRARCKGELELVATHTLPELMAAIARVDVMVCPDGGALHIAAALGKPTIALFGCTDSRVWGPWGVERIVLEGAGSARAIDADQVLDATTQLLGSACSNR